MAGLPEFVTRLCGQLDYLLTSDLSLFKMTSVKSFTVKPVNELEIASFLCLAKGSEEIWILVFQKTVNIGLDISQHP